MEGDDVGDAGTQRSKHRQRSDGGVVGLDVDDVPSAAGDDAMDSRREVVVPSAGPSAHPHDLHALHDLGTGQLAGRVGGQDRDIGVALKQPGDLSDVVLHAADQREVARRDHEQPQTSVFGAGRGGGLGCDRRRRSRIVPAAAYRA